MTGALGAADMEMPRMLHIGLVRSKEVHAEILKIDYERHWKCQVLKQSFLVKMCGEKMRLGRILCHEQPVLAKGKIRFYGEPVVAIVTEALEDAEEAEKGVEIT
ncbi:MAG: hypothetical protein V8S08_11850 [Lachnoclostridium sp.]